MTGGNEWTSSSRQTYGANMGYNAYNPQGDPNAQFGGRTDTNLAQGYLAGWAQAAADQQKQQQIMGMFSGAGMDMAKSMEQQQAMYAQQQRDQQAEYDRRMEEQRLAAGRAKRDELYSGYMSAAGSATDFINSEINKERSNAALLGIDYNIDDNIKSQRISDYFASIWGEGDQASLETHMKDFGAPEGFTGFALKRGNAENYVRPGGDETLAGASKGIPANRTSLVDEDEAYLLGV